MEGTSGAYGLEVELAVHLPSIEHRAAAEDLVQKAHRVCPYPNATPGNIDVELSIT